MYPATHEYRLIEARARQLRADAMRSFFVRLFAKRPARDVQPVGKTA